MQVFDWLRVGRVIAVYCNYYVRPNMRYFLTSWFVIIFVPILIYTDIFFSIKTIYYLILKYNNRQVQTFFISFK